MTSADKNNHEFFEVLSGRKNGNATAEALRKALIDEANAIKQVENNPPDKLTESELSRLEVVKLELIKNGVFRPNETKQHGFISYLSVIQQYLANHLWQVLKIASVPAILIVTFFLYQPNKSDSNLPELERIVKNESKKIDDFVKYNFNNSSVGAIYISAQHGESEIDKLKDNLIYAGADVVETRVNDSERFLLISVTVKSKVDAIKTLLLEVGVKVNGEPPYKVAVKSK